VKVHGHKVLPDIDFKSQMNRNFDIPGIKIDVRSVNFHNGVLSTSTYEANSMMDCTCVHMFPFRLLHTYM